MFTISTDQVIYAFRPDNEPVLETEPDCEIIFQTKDCFSNQIQSEKDLFNAVSWSTINPATGPVAIKGAEPGDTLVVDIVSIKVPDKGVMITVPQMGGFGHRLTATETKIIPIEGGEAVFNERVRVPLAPMIGVIGTAPASEEIPCGTPGPHGGNMDTRLITTGSRLYLPVFVSGALLAMGDLHAVMGDGEVSICGVEIPGEIVVKVALIKGSQMACPCGQFL